MTNFKEMWFQAMCDIFNKVEMQTMKQEEYLELERQLEMIKERILLWVPEQDKALAVFYLNAMEECYMQMYNMIMKDIVTTVEFKEFDF